MCFFWGMLNLLNDFEEIHIFGNKNMLDDDALDDFWLDGWINYVDLMTVDQ